MYKQFFLLVSFAVLMAGCGQGAGNGSATSSSATGPAQTTLLVWSGAGADGTDLGCLLASFARDGVNVQLVDETNIGAMNAQELAGHTVLIFPDGTASDVLSALPAAAQQLIETAVNTYGLHLVTSGSTAAVPANLNLVPTSSSFWSTIIDIVEVVLDGLSIFLPEASVISKFIDGLPALVQSASGSGQVTLFAPQTPTPACGTAQSSAPGGGTATVDPLETLIQQIKTLISAT